MEEERRTLRLSDAFETDTGAGGMDSHNDQHKQWEKSVYHGQLPRFI